MKKAIFSAVVILSFVGCAQRLPQRPKPGTAVAKEETKQNPVEKNGGSPLLPSGQQNPGDAPTGGPIGGLPQDRPAPSTPVVIGNNNDGPGADQPGEQPGDQPGEQPPDQPGNQPVSPGVLPAPAVGPAPVLAEPTTQVTPGDSVSNCSFKFDALSPADAAKSLEGWAGLWIDSSPSTEVGENQKWSLSLGANVKDIFVGKANLKAGETKPSSFDVLAKALSYKVGSAQNDFRILEIVFMTEPKKEVKCLTYAVKLERSADGKTDVLKVMGPARVLSSKPVPVEEFFERENGKVKVLNRISVQ